MAGICVTLTDETTLGVVDRMADLAEVADLFEVRGDLVVDLDLLTILRAKTQPLIFTCRPVSEGGRYPDDDPRRRLLLLEAIKRGYDYVDIEHRSGLLDVMFEKMGSGLIVSFHDLEATPADLPGLYQAMCAQGADVVKIAVTPRSIADVGRLVDFASWAAVDGPRPVIPIALGPMGLLTRILAGRYGAPFTYAAAAAGREAAPGQLPAALLGDLYRARAITSLTQVYGVLGSDVTRSLSPLLHNRAFQALELDAVYVPLQAESVAAFVQALPALNLAGFSVTRPFKSEIVQFLSEIDETARACGSVNTVMVRDGRFCGATTDDLGVVTPLRKRLGLAGRGVVIVGAGGASRAAAFALQREGARVTVLGRNRAQAVAVARAAGCAAGVIDDLKSMAWDVLINATPVGSSAAPEETPVPEQLHRPGSVVLDMVYDPLETRLLQEAQSAGCTIVDGLEMLIAQAVAQFEMWTGLDAPIEAMKSAALVFVQEQVG
jgi:3-dehydroquinate dehydratase/shikimate dehydrogenase